MSNNSTKPAAAPAALAPAPAAAPARAINMNAGPGALPPSVLAEAARAVSEGVQGTPGLSILSISHRSPAFDAILAKADADLRALLNIPESYAVLWMQGGASTQFHAVAANLLARAPAGAKVPVTADYVVSGTWSSKAAEAARAAGVQVNVVNPTVSKEVTVADPAAWTPTTGKSAPLYSYMCSNETVNGIELLHDEARVLKALHPTAPVVADMSSDLLAMPIDVTKYALIFAGAQKNLGPAGVTLVILRKDLLTTPAHPTARLPVMLDYATYLASNSLYNTPPVYAMFVTGLVLQWMRENGGLKWAVPRAAAKAAKVYAALESMRHYAPIIAKPWRSLTNVVFRVVDADGKPDERLETKFVKFAETRGIEGLAGHRSVGGCRASLYNAVTPEEVDVLVSVLAEFDKLL
ncbi:phosphoserine transaminase [Allomyces macrogynus ATCC 38327]|uniref:phosphoserine transaminase n=1 Tax=Allomyces macrogynus (strain ATCC 38327) TaxID=578462 RepID=A0A0L0S5R7_ALLM3|nr:phosphoserine transaminase [Allomyces macrogynus ATCC 38327]|eukprot:KNE57709.1 phosphoserine transaminase [Allomyces macrogynus ATCC 38327]